ncbi:MAG: diacylglycerol kinase [Gammaproteobacteria bacterium HGW-Gammaproteobacteria-8]|nr:MAG: diacylglycerol kinase [Gammaproteobacteria bacterium HGW-Gammaproteobacteria-8]
MNPATPKNELARLVYATRNSLQGYARVFRDEQAFRMQIAVLIVILPIAAWLAEDWLQFAILVASWALVLVAELGNSAIEATIDRIGTEYHDLAAKAKDAGSAMVMTAMLIAGGVWLAIIADRFLTGT